MRTLDIVFKSDRTKTGWEVLGGHCCRTDKEVRDYVKILGGSLKAVPIGYDCGGFIPTKDDSK